MGEQKKQYPNNFAETQMVKGSLLMSYGMIDQAEQLFSSLLSEESAGDQAAYTWYRLAELNYRNGRIAHAHDLLSAHVLNNIQPSEPPSSLLGKLRADSKAKAKPRAAYLNQAILLDARILISLQRKEEAAQVLAGIRDDSSMTPWMRYNLATSLASVDRGEEAHRIFRSLLITPLHKDDSQLLSDQVYFAIGMNAFRQSKWASAKDWLDRVQLNGDSTESALLASGWVSLVRKDPQGALTAWMELAERPSSHPAVQEAVLNIPYVYERAGALRDALDAYQKAEVTFIAEKTAIESAKEIVSKHDWVDRITPELTLNDDPMGEMPNFEFTPDNASPWLYPLFASNEFGASIREYREAQRFHQILYQWQQQIPILQTMIKTQIARREKLEKILDGKTTLAKAFTERVRAREQAISNEVDRIVTTADDFGTPDDSQLAVIERMKAIEQVLARLPAGEYGAEKARFNLLKGVLAWNLSEKAPERRWKMIKTRNQLENILLETDQLVVRVNQINQKEIERLNQQATRILQTNEQLEALRNASITMLAKQRKYLQARALKSLSDQQARLDQLRGYCLLAMARLQDRAYSSDADSEKLPPPAGVIMPKGVREALEIAAAPAVSREPQGPRSLQEAIELWRSGGQEKEKEKGPKNNSEEQATP
ncbi:Hypothetical protein HDN1F_30110 [gamma proteobacterium HdN1]|nr:Hypothetical protein HDN1F_30110 [gamma proteobacterium HdN1]